MVDDLLDELEQLLLLEQCLDIVDDLIEAALGDQELDSLLLHLRGRLLHYLDQGDEE